MANEPTTPSIEIKEIGNAASAAQLAYYFLKKVPSTVNNADEFFLSLREQLLKIELSKSYLSNLMDDVKKIEGGMDWKIWDDEKTFEAEVEFTLESVFNTCIERLSMQESIQLQNTMVDELIKYEGGNNVPVDDNSNPDPEAKLAYYFLKKVTTLDEPDAFFASLRQQVMEINLTDSYISNLKEELSTMGELNIDWAGWELNELEAEVEFVLLSLLRTCDERLSMNETIETQNELFVSLRSILGTRDDGRSSASSPAEPTSAGDSKPDDGGYDSSQQGVSDASPSLWNIIKDTFNLDCSITIKNNSDYKLRAILVYCTSTRASNWKARHRQNEDIGVNQETAQETNVIRSTYTSEIIINPQAVKKCRIHQDAEGAEVTPENYNDPNETWGRNIFISKGNELIVSGQPQPKEHRQICFQNKTDESLLVTCTQANTATSEIHSFEGTIDPNTERSFNIYPGYAAAHFTIKDNENITD